MGDSCGLIAISTTNDTLQLSYIIAPLYENIIFRGIVMISLHNINKFYNSGTQKFHALKDVNIVFLKKEWFS